MSNSDPTQIRALLDEVDSKETVDTNTLNELIALLRLTNDEEMDCRKIEVDGREKGELTTAQAGNLILYRKRQNLLKTLLRNHELQKGVENGGRFLCRDCLRLHRNESKCSQCNATLKLTSKGDLELLVSGVRAKEVRDVTEYLSRSLTAIVLSPSVKSVKIFLSAVSDEFRDYRDQLRSDLTRHNVEVKIQEDFKDYGVVTLDKIDLYISTCDAVVHLVGDMTGFDAKPASTRSIITKYPDIAENIPPLREPLKQGLGISYTQWEAWLALYHGKVLLIAKAEASAPRGPNYAPSETSNALQQIHLQRLGDLERYPGFTFTSPDNLAKQIAFTTILDLLAR